MGVIRAVIVCVPGPRSERVEVGEEGVGENLKTELKGKTEERARALGLDIGAGRDFGNSGRF